MGSIVPVRDMRCVEVGAVQRAGASSSHKPPAQESQDRQEGFCGNADTGGRDDDRFANPLLTKASRLPWRVSPVIVWYRSAFLFDSFISACGLSGLPDDFDFALFELQEPWRWQSKSQNPDNWARSFCDLDLVLFPVGLIDPRDGLCVARGDREGVVANETAPRASRARRHRTGHQAVVGT